MPKRSKQMLFNYFFHRRYSEVKTQYGAGDSSFVEGITRKDARIVAREKAREDVRDIKVVEEEQKNNPNSSEYVEQRKEDVINEQAEQH